MDYFRTKNPNLGKFWRALKWKMLVYFKCIWNIGKSAIWYIVWPIGYLVVFWYIFSRFGILFYEKSGNPGQLARVHNWSESWKFCSGGKRLKSRQYFWPELRRPVRHNLPLVTASVNLVRIFCPNFFTTVCTIFFSHLFIPNFAHVLKANIPNAFKPLYLNWIILKISNKYLGEVLLFIDKLQNASQCHQTCGTKTSYSLAYCS
jgi:hypothetical protein